MLFIINKAINLRFITNFGSNTLALNRSYTYISLLNHKGFKFTVLNPNIISQRNKVTRSSLPTEFSRPIKIPNDPYKLSKLVEDLSSSQRLNDAIVLLMRASSTFQQPIIPWNILLIETIKANKLNLALKLFNELKKRGIKPNDRTYTILLDGCSKSNAPSAPEKAQKLLEEMKSRGVSNEISNSGFTKDKKNRVDNSSKIITREIRTGNDKILTIVDEVAQVNEPSVIHYNNMLKVYSRSNNLIKMISLYDRMRAVALPHLKFEENEINYQNQVNCKPDIVSYTIVANALARLKSDDAFIETLNIWLDYRQDYEYYQSNFNNPSKSLNSHSKFGRKKSSNVLDQRNMDFDLGFLKALVQASRYCQNEEYLYKGLQMIDYAFDMRLNINYPTTDTFCNLPNLKPEEINQIQTHSKPDCSLLDITLTITSMLKLYSITPKVLMFFLERYPQDVKPDLHHFEITLSNHCHLVKHILNCK